MCRKHAHHTCCVARSCRSDLRFFFSYFCFLAAEEGSVLPSSGGSEDFSPEDEVVACVCGATRDSGEGGFLVQCCNPLCRIWQHGACVGLLSEAEAHLTDFFCDACRGLSTALRPAPAAAAAAAGSACLSADPLSVGDLPTGSARFGGDAEEAAREKWRRGHDAKACAAVLQHSLAADCAPQLVALLECSRKQHLLAALGGETLGTLAARAGAARCLAAVLRLSSAAAAPPPPAGGVQQKRLKQQEEQLAVNGAPVGTPVAALYAALDSGAVPAAQAVLREFPGLLSACCAPGFAGSSAAAGLPKEQQGFTPLHAAACSSTPAALALLLERIPEAVPRMAAAVDAAGATPLMLCAAGQGDSAALFRELISPPCLPSGTSAEQLLQWADSAGQNAAHYAAGAGACEILQEIHKAWSGSIHSTDHHRITPLHAACSEGKVEAVRLLIQLGASTMARDAQEW